MNNPKMPMFKFLILGLSFTSSLCMAQQALVDQAIKAMGGLSKLESIHTLQYKASMKQWEPEQSFEAGGEMKFASNSNFEVKRNFDEGLVQVDWVKNFVYPTTRTYTFSEVVRPNAGYIAGIESNTRVKQNKESDPPGHTMSSVRLAVAHREFARSSALLLIEMKRHPLRVQACADVLIDGVSYSALKYVLNDQRNDQVFTVIFDSTTKLPLRVRTLDYDNIHGDVTYDLVFREWGQWGGVILPSKMSYEFDGRLISDIDVKDYQLNPALSEANFSIPAKLLSSAAKPAVGMINFQWPIRRQIIGTLIDSDNNAFDMQAVSDLALTPLAPGVDHQSRGSANSLIVEMKDHLVVFDAPTTDWQSKRTIELIQTKYVGKPIKYLILTHHHMDHAGGFRAYAAIGATLVVGSSNVAHFKKMLNAPYTLNPDLQGGSLARTKIIEVKDVFKDSDGSREVSAWLLENTHAKGMLFGYVSDVQIGFVTDLWAPGRDQIKGKLNATQSQLAKAVEKAGLKPLLFAGGHGQTAPYSQISEAQ